MDSLSSPLTDVFFYSYYLNPEVLTQFGGTARNPRTARLHGWQLHLGNHSTLIPSAEAYADGVIYALTLNELAALYKRDGICVFEPQEIEVYLLQEKRFSPAVCYFAADGPSLLPPPNTHYVQQMITSMQQQRLDTSSAERWLYL